MTQAQIKLIRSAMRMAAKRGCNPYDTSASYAKAYATLARLNQGKNTVTAK